MSENKQKKADYEFGERLSFFDEEELFNRDYRYGRTGLYKTESYLNFRNGDIL